MRHRHPNSRRARTALTCVHDQQLQTRQRRGRRSGVAAKNRYHRQPGSGPRSVGPNEPDAVRGKLDERDTLRAPNALSPTMTTKPTGTDAAAITTVPTITPVATTSSCTS